jgi:hypothetical protein
MKPKVEKEKEREREKEKEKEKEENGGIEIDTNDWLSELLK